MMQSHGWSIFIMVYLTIVPYIQVLIDLQVPNIGYCVCPIHIYMYTLIYFIYSSACHLCSACVFLGFHVFFLICHCTFLSLYLLAVFYRPDSILLTWFHRACTRRHLGTHIVSAWPSFHRAHAQSLLLDAGSTLLFKLSRLPHYWYCFMW